MSCIEARISLSHQRRFYMEESQDKGKAMRLERSGEYGGSISKSSSYRVWEQTCSSRTAILPIVGGIATVT